MWHIQFWMDSFHTWNKSSLAWVVMCNNLWSWPISSRSFRHDFTIKLLKHSTSCHVRSTAHTLFDGFFPYFCTCLWVGYRMAKKLIGLYMENTFYKQWHQNIEWRTQDSLTNFEDHFGLHVCYFLRPQYVWFLVHLYVALIPNSCGRTNCWHYSTLVDLY